MWGDSRRTQYDLVVEQPVAALQQQLQALFPGENIQVSTNEDATVLSGTVSSTSVMLRAGEISTAAAAKRKVINLRRFLVEAKASKYSCRFALPKSIETQSRSSASTSLPLVPRPPGGSPTGQFAAPNFDDSNGGVVFSDFLNLFFFNRKEGLGAAIKALEQKGLFQSLAEPNLIAYNGQERAFWLAVIPVPVVQGNTGSVTISSRSLASASCSLPRLPAT